MAGKENIRLAFVATSDGGNNLFIDNVEFYVDDNTSPVSIESQYEVYGVGSNVKLTFNLAEKETVHLKIYNMLGQPVLEDQLFDVLNQTYTFDIHQQGTGIYIIWVQFANQVGSSKVFLTGSN
ncbi:MAG: T9SS type A sorting domain-containing protein [Flammeovirgaceae bacterium]|nr:T9SS type A sorting domain-containing protein [Flammeovirgaceae bacterium]